MVLTLCAALALSSRQAESQVLEDWGLQTLKLIRENFYLPDKLLYAEKFELGKAPGQIAFNWSAGVLLSALNAGARADPRVRQSLEEFANAVHIYWNEGRPVAGFDVLPMPKPADRYYDDNAWMVMALAETAETLHQPKFLKWSQAALTFVLSGEDHKLGGGIYWHEQERKSKNTCSTGPAAAACLAVYHQTKQSKLLVDAIRLYRWTKETLQDPEDHLFWDSISLDGIVERSKWSYNTGLMIRSAAELYSITHNPEYLRDLKQMQASSAKRWLSGRLQDPGRFAHLLMESWIWQRTLVPILNRNQTADDERALFEPLKYLHDHARQQDGFYGGRFDSAPPSGEQTFELIDQASAARAYFEAASYLKSKA